MKNRNAVLSMVVAIYALLLPLAVVASAQEMGTITGRITAEDGKGLADVMVVASSEGISRRAFTDAEGNFQFTDLPPRSYRISIALPLKVYVFKTNAAQRQRRYLPGDHVTLNVIKGGVLTGRVLSTNGEPLTSVQVTATRVRDEEGKKLNAAAGFSRLTDDRGVYRIYGLAPGKYLLSTGPSSSAAIYSPYLGEAPTYYPSATRDTALEVNVNGGEEVSNIDIYYRGEAGRTISGKIAGEDGQRVSVLLRHKVTRALIAATHAQLNQNDTGFALRGLADGDYELMAFRYEGDGQVAARSELRHVVVRGADVTGLQLSLFRLASVAGRIMVAPAPNNCDTKLSAFPVALNEFRVTAQNTEKPTPESLFLTRTNTAVVPDKNGEFTLRGLEPGHVELSITPPEDRWFVKSLTRPAPDKRTAKSEQDLGRQRLILNAQETLNGVTITMAPGAAGLQGKVNTPDTASQSKQMIVHLIPASAEQADNLLRYQEQVLASDKGFDFRNVAPGNYWLLLLPTTASNGSSTTSPMPAAWDATERTKLRKQAATAKLEIELKPCQQVKDYRLQP